MRRPTELPPVFAQYTPLVAYVQQVSAKEYSSSCPNCGGTVHEDGEWPDRCRWFNDETPLGWCRQCNQIFWPNKAPGWEPPSLEQLETWRKERERREILRRESAQRALENLRSSRLWEQFHAQLDDFARAYWYRRGIPDSMQSFWKLGWVYNHPFWRADTEFHWNAATIPIFSQGWQCQNIKLRLEPTPMEYAKYRYLTSGTNGLLWLANPDAEVAGHVIAVEGEIKAMVVALYAGERIGVTVGLPGITPSQEVLNSLGRAEKITLIADPGAGKQALDIARKLGLSRCWLLIPPCKIDDGILASSLTDRDVQVLIRSALKLSAYVTS